jgi:AraC-like DNA-binding protein
VVGHPPSGRLRRASDALPMPSAYFKFVLEQFGTTPALREAILEGTGVKAADVASLGEEITVAQQLCQSRNVNAIAPPGWGLALGARLDSVAHGALGFAAVSAPTLRDTLELLVRYGHVRDPSFGFRLRKAGRSVRIELHERIDLLEEERLPEIESFLLSLQAIVQSIVGRKLDGTKVEVAARPAHADLYRRYFSGAVSFGAEVSALVIPESWLERPSPFADPALHRVSLLSLEAMAERLKGKRYTAALVEELMASGGQGGRSLEEVARKLAVSKRTLIRRLREAGTTYRELRDTHRRQRAIELLSATSLTAAEIAYRLGYEDASNFGKACQRWFGASPGALRKRLREGSRQGRRRGESRSPRRAGTPRSSTSGTSSL